MNETDQSVSRENEIKKTPSSLVVFVVAELLSLAAIVAVGWFLIGYYTQFEFLQTGYQDWIYNAFRIRDVSQFGIASWDHIWGNGINHWRAFQYVSYVVVFLVVKLTGFSITHAMMWVSAVVFIALRIFLYGILRKLGINRLASIFAVIASYAVSQQWVSLKDFLFVGFIVVPFYVWLWAYVVKDKNTRGIYLLAALTGASWSIHPVVGYSLSGLFGLFILANNIKQNSRKFILSIAVFFISSAPFSVPYLFSGYSISNPSFTTPQFMKMLLASNNYLGLSLPYFIFISLCWILLLIKSEQIPRWAKLLLFYSTIYLIFIYFGLLGYYPEFINKFQFSRAIPLISILLVFCFATFFHVLLTSSKSRIVPLVFIAIGAILITHSISIASSYSGQPSSSIQNPVEMLFAGKGVPSGSVYFKNVPEASYFSKSGVRFVTSYNQHLILNPYPMRFDMLMKTDIAYTGATDHQIDLINDYATVLGVEYIFIPKLSPLVSGLTVDRESSKALFEKVDEVNVPSDTYAVLHNKNPIANAYAFESDQVGELLRFDDLPKPTLKATSYVPWDDEIRRTADLIRDGKLTPIKLSFEWPNRLTVDGSMLSSFRDPEILVNQSYDDGWHATNIRNVRIEPTNLRFMHISLLVNERPNEIDLENTWPWWHWPVQSLGVMSIAITTIAFVVSGWWRKRGLDAVSN